MLWNSLRRTVKEVGLYTSVVLRAGWGCGASDYIWRQFYCHIVQGATGIWWVEARDAAQHLAVHGLPLESAVICPRISIDRVEKLWYKVTWRNTMNYSIKKEVQNHVYTMISHLLLNIFMLVYTYKKYWKIHTKLLIHTLFFHSFNKHWVPVAPGITPS